MQALQSYPVFEADQVLSNVHLNNLLNYLEQQERLTRIKLLGRGIVCGMEINSSNRGIAISKGIALTSQGYLLQICETLYSHFIPYTSPELPNDLYFLKQCGNLGKRDIPYYSKDDVLELVPVSDKELENKKSLNTIPLQDYVVVLFLEAEQIDLKNCDTQDCNDKGSRMDFILKPLLVKKVNLNTSTKISFHSILLKRFNVPVADMSTTTDILQGFMDITDDTTLDNLSKNLSNSWERFAVTLGLPKQNPMKGLDLISFRKKLDSSPTQKIYTQYFYDFVDDLLKAYIEFRSKVREVFGECCPDEMDFPLHMNLGLANQNTLLGRRNTFRQYFESSPIINGQDQKIEEAALLLERLVAMVEGYSIDKLNPQEPIVITPSNLGHEYLSYRAIPYYYNWERINPFWYFNRSYSGNEAYNLGYRAAAQTNAPKPVKNPLLYDIERFDAFRIEGHIGINYRIALRELISKKQSFNLPFDVLALNAIDLTDILNGRNIKCHIEDLESDYRVMITGIVCQLQQIIAYVGDLRPKKTIPETDKVVEAARFNDFYISRNLADMQKTIRNDVSKNQPISITNAEIIQNLALKNAEPGDKLADLVSIDVGNFIINHKGFYEYIIRQPDLLLIFLKQLAEIVKYLLAHNLQSFDEEAYGKIWTPYSKTVDKLIAEAENSENPEIRRYFSKSNYELYFKCPNEKLFALKEEYRQRLEQYHAAVNFNEYFKKHPGMEHKAGVPKGGTFILVYHGAIRPSISQSNLTLISEAANNRATAIFAAEKDTLKTPSIRTESKDISKNILSADIKTVRKTEYALASDLIKNLNLGFDISKVLEALASRDKEVRDQPLRIATGTVIADFYLPYMCCSDCQPIAYVIPEEKEPEIIPPTIELETTVYCDNDNTIYPIKVAPEGGVLKINNTPSNDLHLNPSKLGSGNFTLSYEINDQVAETKITVSKSIIAKINLSDVSFNEKSGWTIGLNPGIDQNTPHTWSINGNEISQKGSITRKFEPGHQGEKVGIKVLNEAPCSDSEKNADLRIDHSKFDICVNQEIFSHKMEVTGLKNVIDIEGIKISGNTISLETKRAFANRNNRIVFAVFAEMENGFSFSSIVYELVNAAFTIFFQQINDTNVSRPPQNFLQITLTPRYPNGESVWIVNGERTVESIIRITFERLRSLKEISVSHQAVFPDLKCEDQKSITIPIETLLEKLKAGNGRYTETVN
ncbi:hypothetical protein SAMN00777080_0514 [Aquiflexum balticum DSM 16537]|uniref:Uncharacterized protein n=1 Tax=Aquiflexum balticum DSM 16537 TaxID=758820 RepID=A0A1W2H023_9BACT|nr:hypothetical protein [Aquiflexum balticum]SMD41978.1 hypothetical protein SAMN00777080_0514 [Aquiflexum balticum DSM 16537]